MNKNIYLTAGAALLASACATTTPIEKAGLTYENNPSSVVREVANLTGFPRLERLVEEVRPDLNEAEFTPWLTSYEATTGYDPKSFQETLDHIVAIADVHYNISPGGCIAQADLPRSLVDEAEKETNPAETYRVAAEWLMEPIYSQEKTANGRLYEVLGYARASEGCLANGDKVRMAATGSAIDNRNRTALLAAATHLIHLNPGGNGGSNPFGLGSDVDDLGNVTGNFK